MVKNAELSETARYIKNLQNKNLTGRKVKLVEASSFIDSIKKYLGLDNDYFVIMSRWQQEVGNSKVELNGFRNGTIFAVTKSAPYLNDINLRKRQIINRLNQYLGKKLVKNIKCEIR